MDDLRFGSVVRAVRVKRAWRQCDVAARAGLSPSTVSRLERGHVGTLSVDAIRAIGAVLEIRVELVGRWRAGDLDRLLNRAHSALHDEVARMFRGVLPDWVLAPEVSFAILGERGVIDLLAWHPGRRVLLVVELKTDIADLNELLGTFDRKRRLAWRIAADRGWHPDVVAGWVIVAASRTNRRRIAEHRALLRAAFPMDGRGIERWLRDPRGAASALSFWIGMDRSRRLRSTRRVRVPRGGPGVARLPSTDR